MFMATRARAAVVRARRALEAFAVAANAPTLLEDVDGGSAWEYFTNALRAARGSLADRRILDALGDHVVGRLLAREPTTSGFFAFEDDEQGVYVYDSNEKTRACRRTANKRPIDLA